MKLTLQLHLLPTPEQHTALRDTMARFNEAASYAAQVGFTAGVFGQVSLHHLAYYQIRERFGLSSQMAVRAIAKAVECFQRDKTVCPIFKPESAICYDQRVLSFKGLNEVSLWALTGRLRMSFVCGAYQQARQGRIQGQADLVLRDGLFYLLCTIDMPEDTPITPTEVMGVDLGVVNLATTSDGATYSGTKIEACRSRYARRRQRLQQAASVVKAKGKRPKNIRRALQRTVHHEARFRRDVNHVISKQLVATAKGTDRGIALEDLTHIRSRGRFRRAQRARIHGWSFGQLRRFVTYKAQLAGVPVYAVDPRDTSRSCNVCGHCVTANRPSQAVFSCQRCSYTTHADFNAALNIRARGLVNIPKVAAPTQLLLRLVEPATSCLL